MRTLTSGKGKVHHIPTRREDGIRGAYTVYLCGRGSDNAVTHESGKATCQGCLGKLRTEEFEAYWEAQCRRQRAEEAAAYERIAQREAEEKALREAQRVTPALHTVELKALPNYGADNWTSDASGDGQPRLVYRMHSKYGRGNMRFTIFYVGPNGEARRVHGGPVLSGPYCALVPMSSVISAHPGVREEAVEVKEGDVLLLNGVPMILIDDQAYEYPHAVTPAEYGARLAAREVKKLHAENIRTTDRAPWDAALQEAHLAITALYRNGHTVLPFAFDAPTEDAPESVEWKPTTLYQWEDYDWTYHVLGTESRAGLTGVWLELCDPGVPPGGGVTDWYAEDRLVYLGFHADKRTTEFRDCYVSYAGNAFQVLGTGGDECRSGIWVRNAQNDTEPALFVRLDGYGHGDPVAAHMFAWGMASTITGEVIQWDNAQGHYVDRQNNVRTDIQLS